MPYLKQAKSKKIWLALAPLMVLLLALPRAGYKVSADSLGSFSLTSNNAFCVGQTPVYSITSSTSWAGQNINWTSSHNGQTNSQTTFTLDSNGSWSASGSTWQSGDVGS